MYVCMYNMIYILYTIQYKYYIYIISLHTYIVLATMILHKHISYTHVARSLGRGRKKSPRRPKRSNFSCFLSASPKRPAAAATMYYNMYIHIAGRMYIIPVTICSVYVIIIHSRYVWPRSII